ncbi:MULTISPECIES: glycosyltransferase [unclassified Neisseria]|uniref:glycosyltransferase n=1 Tax=unclassified Neisseria TaxID=2623750 RepID=UPI001072132C|nr:MULTISPECIES: glycosyltransferase [unclassified Neisseria]MBF0803991.1 glycosyltransferase [Neisseria sp. 19428wB4_WF04]TFU43262.1 glycosyltransferase family 4 protein [Neisseria sp. WF04]
MHVLIIPSWYPATAEDVDGIFFRQQAQALQRSGLQVGVIAPLFRSLRRTKTILTGGYGIRSYIEEAIPTYVYKSMYFFPRLPPDRARWVKAGKKLFERYVREHGQPDIIHAHAMNFGGILAYEIHSETGIPFVITEHSSTYARKLIHDWQWAAMHRSAAACAGRIAVSKHFCGLLRTEYRGLDWKYIPNMLSAKAAAPFNPAEKPRGNHFTFCSVAHLNFNKGFDILLPAFAQALKTHPGLKLQIGGTGMADAELHALSEKLGLRNAVTFLGALKYDEVLDLMRRSDAFVLASRNETFGVVYIEALSQGLPVVATRCGGPESIVTPENGLLVPKENVQALTQALIDIYENRSRYDAATLRNNCLKEFSEKSVVSQITEEYRRILPATPV